MAEGVWDTREPSLVHHHPRRPVEPVVPVAAIVHVGAVAVVSAVVVVVAVAVVRDVVVGEAVAGVVPWQHVPVSASVSE